MTFRSVLERLEAAGELKRVGAPVPLGSVAQRIADEEAAANRALLFTGFLDAPGWLATNVYGTLARVASAVDTTPAILWDVLQQAVVRPGVPRTGPAAWKAEGPVNLGHLPIPVHSAEDAGPYLTAGVVILEDPATGLTNLSYVRLQVQGRDRLGFNAATPHTAAIAARALEGQGRLEVAVAIGVPPAMALVAAATTDEGRDDLGVAAALDPQLTLAGCDSVALQAPAEAEILIQGEIRAGETALEGPFGESMGTYTAPVLRPVIRVRQVAFRPDAILHSVAGGQSAEHITLLGLKVHQELATLQGTFPEIVRVTLPRVGGARLVILTLRDRRPASAILRAVLGIRLVRMAICVDPDVDPERAEDLAWSLVRRTREAGRILLLPASDRRGPLTKIGVDATAVSFGAMDERRVQPAPWQDPAGDRA